MLDKKDVEFYFRIGHFLLIFPLALMNGKREM